MAKELLKVTNVVCMFPSLDQPKAFEGQTEAQAKYGIRVLIPKTDKAQIQAIKDFVTKSVNANAKWTEPVKKQVLKVAFNSADAHNDNAILRDGDAQNKKRKDEGKPVVLEEVDHYTLGAKRGQKVGPPAVFDERGQQVPAGLVAGTIVSGYKVNIAISAYCYDKPKPGFTFNLEAVKLKEADIKAVNPFEDEDDDLDDSEESGDVFAD